MSSLSFKIEGEINLNKVTHFRNCSKNMMGVCRYLPRNIVPSELAIFNNGSRQGHLVTTLTQTSRPIMVCITSSWELSIMLTT